MERLPDARAPGVRHLGREGLRRNAARGLAIGTEISYTPAAAKLRAVRQPCSSCCCRSARRCPKPNRTHLRQASWPTLKTSAAGPMRTRLPQAETIAWA